MTRSYLFVEPAPFPRADGSTAPDDFEIPGVTLFTSQRVPTPGRKLPVEAEFLEGVYAPSAADLAWLDGREYDLRGWVRHCLHLPPRYGRPVVLFLYGPCYEIADEDGDLRSRWAPLPDGFDPELGLYVDFEAQLVEMLGHHSVADCARRTLVPRSTLETLRDGLDAWHRDAMRAGGARPRQIAVSRVRLPGEAGARHAALHVVAGAPDSGRAWTLAVLDWTLDAEDIAACLAEELSNLPDPLAVESVWTPSDPALLAVVREALAMAPCSVPGFAAAMVIAGPGDARCAGADPFRSAVTELDRGLEALARATPLKLEHLEKQALVRQGFAAARRWRCAEGLFSGGAADAG